MPETSTNGGKSWKDSDWLGLIPAAIAFIVMAVLSWRKWPDPIIDFGGQLYIPWQLSAGKVLYRDVMYLPGPVSQYYHALLFKIFGVSFNAIIASNFAILIGFVVLVHRLFLRCADRLTAAVIVLAVVLGFAFAQFLDVGNYNYIAPYSHEIWHAIVLATVMIGCFGNWLRDRRLMWLVIAGLCYGTIFLMKPENFVAASGIVFVAFLLTRNKTSSIPQWLAFIGVSLLPIVAMFLVFFAHEDASTSLRGACGGWVPLVTTHMSSGAFFQTGMGLDLPKYHLRLMLLHIVVLVAVVSLCAWRFRAQQHRIERIVLFCVLAGLAINFDWTQCGRSLPFILICSFVMIAHHWLRSSDAEREKYTLPLLWIVFAALLLLKMGLYPRIIHYGVFLAMPAFVAAIYVLLSLLPNLFPAAIHRTPFRTVMTTLVAIGIVRLAIQSALFYADKDYSIGEGGDRIVAYNPKVSPAGEAVARAVGWLNANAPQNATVAALPEGAMINYLSRRRNPTPFIVFMSEIYAFGEEKMAAPYYASPPEYILLVHRPTAEYGLRFFGQQKGYGLDMLAWIDKNYDAVELIGAEPLRTGDFGIKILKHKAKE